MQNPEVVVLGLGYIGLPTAALIAKNKVKVLGVDVNQSVVDTVNRGEIHIVEPLLEEEINHAVENGYLSAALKPVAADTFIIVVPTPFKNRNEPDISFVQSAVRTIQPWLEKGNLVIIESTSPVGTTEKVSDMIFSERPELANELRIAYCPERVLPGNVMFELINNDRVIGGIDQKSTDAAIEFYGRFVKSELFPTNAKTAEMCKLHCIAVDPYFIVSEYPIETKIIGAAREVNNYKSFWCAEKAENAKLKFELENGYKPKMAIMGLAFKPNIDDLRESPAKYIAQKILQNAKSDETHFIVEPNIKEHHIFKLTDYKFAAEQADIIIFLVAHDQFQELEISKGKIILDFAGINKK